MGVGVLIFSVRKQRACRLQVLQDRPFNRIELVVDDAPLAAEPPPVLAIAANGLDNELGPDSVGLAQLEVGVALFGRLRDPAVASVGGDAQAGGEGGGLGE